MPHDCPSFDHTPPLEYQHKIKRRAKARTDIAEIAKGLTEAQQRAILGARYFEQESAHWPAGYYFRADKRVRYALSPHIIRDYLKERNRLTPLGLAVRAHLQEASHE